MTVFQKLYTFHISSDPIRPRYQYISLGHNYTLNDNAKKSTIYSKKMRRAAPSFAGNECDIVVIWRPCLVSITPREPRAVIISNDAFTIMRRAMRNTRMWCMNVPKPCELMLYTFPKKITTKQVKVIRRSRGK